MCCFSSNCPRDMFKDSVCKYCDYLYSPLDSIMPFIFSTVGEISVFVYIWIKNMVEICVVNLNLHKIP